MSTQLILFKRELSPDVYFEDETLWTLGLNWTLYKDNTLGLGAEHLSGNASSLQLTNTELKPYRTYKWIVRVEQNTNAGVDYCRLVIGGTTVQTFNATMTPTIYTGSIQISSNTTVLIQASAGNDSLISYLSFSEYPDSCEIEITDDIDVPLNLSIANVNDPEKRDASYSRTVQLPGTKENNQYFGHIFEISAEGTFNANKKVRALIVNGGVQQFFGNCRLDNINRLVNGINNYSVVSYDITLFGDLGDLFLELGDTQLNELDFSEYDHTYTKANQKSSWYSGIIKDGAPFTNTVDGAYLTITSCQNNGGYVQMNCSGAHNLAVGDWVLFPENSITNGYGVNGGPQLYYLGEHQVYSIVSANNFVLRCPYYATAGSITTASVGTDRVRKHSKTGEGYVYSLIDYDQNDGYNVKVNQLYPSIYVKNIIDKIFAKGKYVYDCSLFDSVMFKKLTIPFTGGNLKLTDAEIASRLFLAGNTNNDLDTYTTVNNGFGIYSYSGTITPIDIQMDVDNVSPFFDNGGVFNTGTYRYVPSDTGIYSMQFSGAGQFAYVNMGETFVSVITQPVIQIEVYDYTLASVVGTCIFQHSPTTIYDTSTNLSSFEINIDVDNVQMTAGNSYGIRCRVINAGILQFVGGGGTMTMSYGVFGTTCAWGNKITNTNIQIGDTVYMNGVLPKMKCTEFLTNIIRVFNLYLDKDKTNDRKFFIESRDDFYSNGVEVEWTSKLDVSQNILQTPMASLQGKQISFGYAQDSDFYNKDHKEKYDITYGNKIYQVDNDFKKDKYEIGVTFGSSILADMAGKVVTNMQAGTNSNSANDAFSGKLRILVFNCASTTFEGWYHKNDDTDVSSFKRLYPYSGHLDKPDAPYFDLNYWYPRGVYFDYDSWTDRNLFNLYWKRFTEEVTDRDSKLVTCYMNLTTADVFTLDFRNTFVIDGNRFRLNKIIDFLVGKNIPVKCEFLKIKDSAVFASSVGGNEVGTGFVSMESFDYGLPQYIGNGNGDQQGANNRVIVNGDSDVGKYSYNVIVNGDSNLVGKSSSNILVTGDGNTVAPNCEDITLLNCSGMEVDVEDNGKTFINNGIVIPNRWKTAVYSALAPESVDGSYSDYEHDGSSGDITYMFDIARLESGSVNIKVIDAGGDIIITSLDGSGTFEGNALPYTISVALYDSFTIFSNGTDLRLR